MLFIKKMKEIPKPLADFIAFSGNLADRKGLRVFIVGGFVRDLFLGVSNFDVDIAVEGDAVAFARTLADQLSCSILVHKRFGTAVIRSPEGFKVDIATARREVYEKPAALPVVAAGAIRDDLFRRDFTINAMAICINKVDYGRVFDFYCGMDDLKKRLVRALHSLSFIDDPTRILRAVRFEQRLGFSIEKETYGWMRAAARSGMLEVVHKHRLRDELVLIFKEEKPFKALSRLYKSCGFDYIFKGLRYERSWGKAFQGVEKAVRWHKKHLVQKRHIESYIMYMSLFFYSLSLKDMKRVMLDFAFHKGESCRILSLKEHFDLIEKSLADKKASPSVVYRVLEPLSCEVILLILALSSEARVKQHVEDFLSVHDGSKLHLTGEDLLLMGVKPGPGFKKILDELLSAKIDGRVKDRCDELKLAEKLILER